MANIGTRIASGKKMHCFRWRRAACLCAIALPLLVSPISATAQDSSVSDADRAQEYANAQEYSACMTLASRTPEDALSSAETWEQRGGGDAAKHCAAVALIGMGKFADAAQRLQALGSSMPADQALLAAQILAQAGIAWQAARENERALVAQTAALKLAPKDVGILIDRSATQFFLGKCWEAIDDLNAAHDLAPERIDILVLRASAYRCVEAFDLARDDVDRALSMRPDDPEALLERGTLRHLAGDDAGARQDWLRVAEIAAGTPAADAAQQNLESLDVRVQ